MGRVLANEYAERGRLAAEALCAHAEGVDALHEFAFDCVQLRIGIGGADLAEQRLFGHLCAQLERAAQPHADDDRRAGIGRRACDRFDNQIFRRLQSLRRVEHIQRGHILAAEALEHDAHFDLVARDKVGVDDRRGVGAGIDARDGIEHGLAQVGIAFPGGAVDCVLEQSSGQKDVFADLDKDDAHPGVLTDGIAHLGGEARVFAHLGQGEVRGRDLFFVACSFERGEAGRFDIAADFDDRLAYFFGDNRGVDSKHSHLLCVLF